MREILFRGKRKDNGEWIYGFYFQKPNVQAKDGQPTRHAISDLPPFGSEVDPETVGQYTGLTDKNGKKIFEGDILKDDWGKQYTVFYTTKSCSFMVKCESATNEYETGNYRIGEAWCGTIQVIGATSTTIRN